MFLFLAGVSVRVRLVNLMLSTLQPVKGQLMSLVSASNLKERDKAIKAATTIRVFI